MKIALNVLDTGVVGDCMEKLMAYAYYFEQGDPSDFSGNRACDALATKFLIFDYVLAGLSVLNQEVPEQLWAEVSAAVPHVFKRDSAALMRSAGRARYVSLAFAFSKAVGRLKATRKRLSPMETVELKKAIFCSTHIPPRFPSPIYNAWRDDCDDGQGSGTGAAGFV